MICLFTLYSPNWLIEPEMNNPVNCIFTFTELQIQTGCVGCDSRRTSLSLLSKVENLRYIMSYITQTHRNSVRFSWENGDLMVMWVVYPWIWPWSYVRALNGHFQHWWPFICNRVRFIMVFSPARISNLKWTDARPLLTMSAIILCAQ